MDLHTVLKNAYSKASQGYWFVRDGCIYVKSFEGGGESILAVAGDPNEQPSEQDACNLEFIRAAHDSMPFLLEALDCVKQARWAFLSLADEASALAEFYPDTNAPWDAGGEGYEASKRIRALCEKLASPINTPLVQLYALWDVLGNTSFSSDGQTTVAPFLQFPPGTERETIWRWFESQNPAFLVGEVIQGIRRQAVTHE